MGFREDFAAAKEQFRKEMAEAGSDVPGFMKGVVAQQSGVTLYRDRIEYDGESRPLAGVSARMVQEPIVKLLPGTAGVSRVYLMVTGPDFEWSVYVGTTPMATPTKVRLFCHRVNKTAP